MIRFTIQDIYRYFIYLIFLLNLSFFNVFSDLTYTMQRISIYLILILFVIYVLQKKKSKLTIAILLAVVLLVVLVLFNLFRQGIPLNGVLSFDSKMFLLRNFSFVLLTFPISEVLHSQSGSKFLKGIFSLGMIAILFRTFSWFAYNYAGLNLTPGLFAERGLNWSRYGAVRLQGLFLDGYILAYLSCKLLVNNSRNKLFYWLLLLITLFYEGIIYGSRSQIIGFLAMFLVIYLFKQRNSVNKLLSYIFMCLALVGVLFSPVFNQFLDSFSVTNSNFGAGTMVRIVGRQYYQEQWSQSKLLGFGITSDGNIFNGWKYYISDLGIARMLYQFGIIGFIICLLPMILGMLVGFKHRLQENGMLLLSLSVFVLITGFASQNLYDYSRIMLLPLLLGLTNAVAMQPNSGEHV